MESVSPCKLLNTSPGAREKVRIPASPSVVERNLYLKDLEPNPLSPLCHRLQGVIQVTDVWASYLRNGTRYPWRARQTDLTEPPLLSCLIKEGANKDSNH